MRLLRAGADPNLQEASSGTSVLGVAAFHGHRDLCRLLLSHGASWHTGVDDREQTAVDDAVRGGQMGLAEYLRFRYTREQSEQLSRAATSKQSDAEGLLAAKADQRQVEEEKSRRMHGLRVAHEMQRAAEHQTQVGCAAARLHASIYSLPPMLSRTRIQQHKQNP